MAVRTFRREKFERELVREISKMILTELQDPRLGFVTVMRAKVSDDLRHAKVFVSVMGEEKKKKLTMQGLQHAHGFIQREMMRRFPVRVFPELVFVLDDSIEKTFDMLDVLGDLAKERRERGVDPPEEAAADDDPLTETENSEQQD